jgi:glyoxylate carboligase
VSAHSSAKFFHEVKIWAVPGIGLSFLALVGILCIWPYLNWVEFPQAQSEGFTVLCSIGNASLAESAVLVRLISGRSSVAS